MARLVVVSNRVSVPTSRRAAAGGLAIGVEAALRERGGLWFGWSGDTDAEPAAAPRIVEDGRISYALIDLTAEERQGYYSGFANRTLWPLFHYRVDLTTFEAAWFDTYGAVNRRFAAALAPLLRDDDLVWVQDYHLIPLGAELRRLGCRNRLGFFLHIPFPAAQLYVALPWHRELVVAMAEYDVIGFHGPTDVEQFGDYVVRELDGRSTADGRMTIGQRSFSVIACPIGIDVREVERLRGSAEAKRQGEGLVRSMGERGLIVGVDRLDYSKGIVERLRAYEMLLRDHEQHRRKVTFLQIAAPSRAEVPEYRELRRSTERLAGHIVGRFGEHDWIPLRYLNRTYSRRAVIGFFARSRVGLVTPLRDGLNLVAEEYVAAQPGDDPGVLVLSRFAGSAALLEGALIVNPYDVPGTCGALHRALTMPLDERRARLDSMLAAVRLNDITAWRKRFVAALEADGDQNIIAEGGKIHPHLNIAL